MKKKSYLIRLDDACPTMDLCLWDKVEDLLDKYKVKPMVGVIPNNEDPKQVICIEDKAFWTKVKRWELKGWTIAMHGYNHVYSSKEGGINPIWKKSEFAGLSIEEQKAKIRNGISIMRKNGFDPSYFFAPSHTFDDNTLHALEEETSIRIISDTVSLKPYKYGDFFFIPQQLGRPRKMCFGGLWTICLHPNTMKESDFTSLEVFLKKSGDRVFSFDQIDVSNISPISLIDKIFRRLYFICRKIR